MSIRLGRKDRIGRGLAALGCAVLLGLGVPQSSELGPEIGTIHGYPAFGLPWRNPCGPTQPWITTNAHMDRTYRPRELNMNDRDIGWSYAVRMSMPDLEGGALDCIEVMDVQYFVMSGFLPYNPPLEISFEVTGSQYAALFVRPMNILPAETVDRDGSVAAEVTYYVPRTIRENLKVYHQGVALVWDIYGELVCILPSNAVAVDVPATIERVPDL